jgi:hypothetical protein
MKIAALLWIFVPQRIILRALNDLVNDALRRLHGAVQGK